MDSMLHNDTIAISHTSSYFLTKRLLSHFFFGKAKSPNPEFTRISCSAEFGDFKKAT